MARKPTPQSLAFSNNLDNDGANADQLPQSAHSTGVKSPGTPRSSRFSTRPTKSSENLQQQMQAAEQHQFQHASRIPSSPDLDALSLDQQAEDPSRQDGQRWISPSSPQKTGFFANIKASTSSNRLQQGEAKRPGTRDNIMSRDNEYQISGAVSSSDISSNNKSREERSTTRKPVAVPSRSEPQLNKYVESAPSETTSSAAPSNNNTSRQRPKPKAFNLLRRTNSTRNDSDGLSPGEPTTLTINDPDRQQALDGLRTAPLRAEHDRSFRDLIMNSKDRNRSADRQVSGHRNETLRKDPKDTHRGQPSISLSRDTTGNSLISSLKGAGTKAASSFGRNFFGKAAMRSSSTNEREAPVDDEHYVFKVLNLPLIEQTRTTRISKQLETSRDKTEYWMPSFPWRAIDYLNYRGTDAEGLYRVPGSGPQIRRWQRKFDEDLDVDLFAQKDLYDINIVGSMLKSWLRELPDELFPKDAQARVSDQSPNCEEVPQVLIDELSNLPPYNYYLLFAITCHLSLVLEHRDANKMNYQNLTVCFLPCMRMDAYCFRFLVVKWRDCWKGCNTETVWIEKEARWHDEMMGLRMADQPRTSTAIDDRNVSSSDSSAPSSFGKSNNQRTTLGQGQGQNQELGRTSTATTLVDGERLGYAYSRDATPGTAHTTDDNSLPVNNQRITGNGRDMLLPIQPMSPLHMPDAP